MTAYEVTREPNQILKMSDEVNTPQRSIMDFFKTPQKEQVTSKPKDLLGFFCRKDISSTKRTPDLICNGKNIPETKENVLNKGKEKKDEKANLPKKRKRSTSKDQDASDDNANDKTSGRKNKLKRKKQETVKTKDNKQTTPKGETVSSEVKSVCNDTEESKTKSGTILSSDNRVCAEINKVEEVIDKDICGSDQNNETDSVQREQMVMIDNSEAEVPKYVGSTTYRSPDVALNGMKKGECSPGKEKEAGATSNLEWNKRIDVEKCRTPRDKDKEKSVKKKNKLKKKKKEADSQESVKKTLNLSDICTNMADVSILSDGGLNTSQVKSSQDDIKNDSTQERGENGTSIPTVNITEVSYDVFLGKEDTEENTEESYEDFLSKQQKENGEDIGANKQDSDKPTHAAEPVKKKRGRPKKTDSLHSTSHGTGKKIFVGDDSKDSKSKDDIPTEGVQEVSYLDYLNTIGEDNSENKGIAKRSIYDILGRGVKTIISQVEDAGSTLKPSDDDGTNIPMPKQYPSITNFFSQVSKNEKFYKSKPKHAKADHLTIKAMIHVPESQNKRESVEKSDKKLVVKKKQLAKHRSEDSIQVLSSEIIVIEDKEMDVDYDRNKKNMKQEKEEKKELEDKEDIIEISEETEAREKKNSFLHSVDAPEKSVKQKTSQATLSFAKGNLKMNKAVKEALEKNPEKTICESTPEPEKRKRGRPKKTCEKENVKTKQHNLSETSHNSSQSSQNSSQVFEDKSEEENVKEERASQSLAERRKSIRLKYKVKLLQNSDAGSPIRMKFMRCAKSSSGSSQDETFTPKSKEKGKNKKMQSKAQKLLAKAKKVKGNQKNLQADCKGKTRKVKKTETPDKIISEAKSDSEDKESGGRRRSSRLSDRQKSLKEIEIVELDDEDEDTNDSCYTPKKKSGAQKQTPAKKSKVKNIASIFLKKKPKAAADSPVKRIIDPEAEKLKRAFLMSGIPAELKQSITAAAVATVANYPPFPRDNHIQQKSESRMWSMVEVILRTVTQADFCTKISQPWCLGITDRQQGTQTLKFEKPVMCEKFKDDTLSCLLKEVSQVCTSFPTQKMYSILKEKQEDEIIEEIEEKSKEKEKKGKPEKEKPRRSLRRRKEVIEIIDVGGSPESKADQDKMEDKQENVAPTLSWPEKYQPFHSSEIIGNTAIIKKLKSWLLEWKQCLDKEAKKAKLLMMKEKKKNKTLNEEEEEEEWWTDDASDFDMDSDSDEEERLCNTAMLTGPLGVGKTATVYALAQELGFKVFEVNASSSRNGKRILAQLQEATQSQQVSKHQFSGTGTPKKLKNPPNVVSSTKQKPTVFTNLFKKAATPNSVTPTEEKSKPGRKKRKRDEDTDKDYKAEKEQKRRKKGEDTTKIVPQEKKKSLNLSCTSLILFDEVDLVFEAFDKGFWAAVKNFMDTTKIPIILTSNDVSLPQKFEGRFEHYKFKVPPVVPTSCYLRLVALAENVRMDWDEIVNLVSIFNSDIRRVLLTLQFWLNSGGGRKVKRSIKEKEPETPQQGLPRVPVIDENSCSQDAFVGFRSGTGTDLNLLGNDEDDDFVSIKPVACKRKQVICDDEGSNLTPPVHDKVLMDAQKCPAMNVSCLESMLGLPIKNEMGILGFLTKTLKEGDSRSEELAIQACQQYLKLKVDLLYGHHLDMLPLHKVTVDNLGPIKQASSPLKTKRRRIKIISDLYDSEGSDSESTNVTEISPIVEKSHKQSETNSKELIGSLSEMAHFYDSLSFMDMLRYQEERIMGNQNSGCGVTEEPRLHEHSEFWMEDHTSAVCSTIEWKCFSKLHRKLNEITVSLPDKEDERFKIPVLNGRSSTLTHGLASPDNRSQSSVKKAYENVLSSLPLSVTGQKSVVMSDYLPYLRSITRDEQIRQAAKIKRRFHHYFDQIGLPLKDQTLEVLRLSLPLNS
ncbi:ATPase family AAA domain-containing protein 5-like [Saccostrea echinata]|uniref:ATPase family AAA domain-containing protein 5-like n=1 Tax=Saccostrea echinata TaxID=191078 RepID=UPI002A8067C7|nr:ATPase family AAA domain-containing protein 5-like [Saccostrea echinata]